MKIKIFKPHKKYQIRHNILAYLFSKMTLNSNHVPNLRATLSTLEEIAKGIGCTIEEVIKYHHGIPDSQAKCGFEGNNTHMMYLNRSGIDAVIDEYWLREGQKEINEKIYDKTKWSIPVISVLVTFASLAYTIYTVSKTKEKVSDLEVKLGKMQTQINEQRGNKNIQNQIYYLHKNPSKSE